MMGSQYFGIEAEHDHHDDVVDQNIKMTNEEIEDGDDQDGHMDAQDQDNDVSDSNSSKSGSSEGSTTRKLIKIEKKI